MSSRQPSKFFSSLALAGILFAGPGSALALDDVSVGLGQDAVRVLGRDAGDEAGTAVAVGDVSGDGVADLVIGAPQSAGVDNGRPKSGEVGVIFGAPGLTDVPKAIAFKQAEHTFYGATESARLGTAVAVGDVDGDGVGDIIMGAPEADAPGSGEGGVFVFYGGSRLTDSARIDLATDRADLAIWGGETGARLGKAIAVGDFNGDHIDDIAMAAPGEGDRFNRHDAGVVYIFFGKRGLERGLEVFPGVFALMTIQGPTMSGGAGSALGAGDINHDGIDDLVIGVPMTGSLRDVTPGLVYVVFGGSTVGPSFPPRDLSQASQVDLRVLAGMPGDRFGSSVAVGDINGGGGDLLIGALGSPLASGARVGRAYAIFGRAFVHGTAMDLSQQEADVTLVGPQDGAQLGTSMAAADLTGDHLDEWIIGAPGADRTGEVYRIAGRNVWTELGVSAALTQGQRPGDLAGTAVATGDVDGDGLADLLFGSPGFDGTALDKPDGGAAYLIISRSGPGSVAGDCVDADGDGFRGQGRTCGPLDCNDANPNIYPGAAEICGDGLDNDCDGNIDGTGVDADGDGYVAGSNLCRPELADCNDADPHIHPGPDAAEVCNNGIDDNCDGKVDGADPQCAPSRVTLEQCDNCVDDDGNGEIDVMEDACPANTIVIENLSARRARRGTSAKRLTAKGMLFDPPFVRDVIPTMIVGLGVKDGEQACLYLSLARNPTKRGAMTYVSTSGGKTVLRVTPKKGGKVVFTLDHHVPLGLSTNGATQIRVGLYADGAVYRGAASVRARGQSLVAH